MTLLAIVIGPLASILTLLVANRQARALASSQAERDQQRWRFEARESRYEDRREAVIAYDSAVSKEVDRIDSWSRDPIYHDVAPGDVHDDYRFPDLMEAFARVSILATPTVFDAADLLQKAVIDHFYGKEDAWKLVQQRLVAYRIAARAMLAEEAA